MSVAQFNEFASRRIWSSLPKAWPGWALSPASLEFENHVCDFQVEHKLLVDGKLGEKTFAKMLEVYSDFVPEFVEVEGVDVSKWQGSAFKSQRYSIDWGLVAGEGYRFAIIKATEGASYDTTIAEELLAGINLTELWVQYYHFGTPHLIKSKDEIPTLAEVLVDAEKEAKFFIDTLRSFPKPKVITFESGRQADVWIDLEHEAPALSPIGGLRWCQRLFEVIEGEGYLAGLYTSKDWLELEVHDYQSLYFRSDHSQRPFWVARYGENNGDYPPGKYNPNAKVPGPWSTFDIHQYTSRGDVAGIENACDLNIARIVL